MIQYHLILLLLLIKYVYNLNELKINLNNSKNNNGRIPCTIYDNNNNIRPHRVVIFVDTSMIDVFMNWLIFYSSTCRGNLEHLDVICMDKRAKVMVKSIGISCNDDYSFTLNTKLLEKNQMKLKTIWLRRLHILYKYMLSGSDVIFSDGDAIWIKDPTPFISKLNLIIKPQPQLISSRAWYPQRLFKKWGATFCMGFIYFKAGPFTLDFTNTMIQDLHLQMALNDTKPDDQVAANYILEKWNITWSRKMVVGANSIPDIGTVIRNNSEYKTILLPHSQFMRKCHSMTSTEIFLAISNATVVHCRLPTGSGSKKESRMKALSLWRLVDKWKYRLLLQYHRNNDTSEIPWVEAIQLIAEKIDQNGKLLKFDKLQDRKYKYHTAIKKGLFPDELKQEANKVILKKRLEKYKNRTKLAKSKAKNTNTKVLKKTKINEVNKKNVDNNNDENMEEHDEVKELGYYDDDYTKKQISNYTDETLLDDLIIKYLDNNTIDSF